jgi:uncharacterized membrane protein
MPSVGPLELLVIAAIWATLLIPLAIAVVLIRRALASRDPALDALRTRLATGDIDEAEYQRLRATLQGH